MCVYILSPIDENDERNRIALCICNQTGPRENVKILLNVLFAYIHCVERIYINGYYNTKAAKERICMCV